MDKSRREYLFPITFNGLKIDTVIIDPHYEEKHSSAINDDLILKLVKNLDGEYYEHVDEKFPFKYFVENNLKVGNKFYRLIWITEEKKHYLGIINAFRSSK